MNKIVRKEQFSEKVFLFEIEAPLIAKSRKPTTERSMPYSAIAFQMGSCLSRMKRGERFSLCYQLEENYWHGKTEIQLSVKDIRFEY